MELYQYIAEKKTKTEGFSQNKFARLLGMSPARLVYIKKYTTIPSGIQAYNIEIATEGKVNGWDLILRCIRHREKKGISQAPSILKCKRTRKKS